MGVQAARRKEMAAALLIGWWLAGLGSTAASAAAEVLSSTSAGDEQRERPPHRDGSPRAAEADDIESDDSRLEVPEPAVGDTDVETDRDVQGLSQTHLVWCLHDRPASNVEQPTTRNEVLPSSYAEVLRAAKVLGLVTRDSSEATVELNSGEHLGFVQWAAQQPEDFASACSVAARVAGVEPLELGPSAIATAQELGLPFLTVFAGAAAGAAAGVWQGRRVADHSAMQEASRQVRHAHTEFDRALDGLHQSVLRRGRSAVWLDASVNATRGDLTTAAERLVRSLYRVGGDSRPPRGASQAIEKVLEYELVRKPWSRVVWWSASQVSGQQAADEIVGLREELRTQLGLFNVSEGEPTRQTA